MLLILNWISENYIELFGAVTGVLYVFLEIKQNRWLWPVGIITSSFYILIFFSGKLYADMSLQVYYLLISITGWYWWAKGTGQTTQGEGQGDVKLTVSRVKFKTGIVLAAVFFLLYLTLWFVLSKLTDSPVPEADSFITSLSIVATWMLARKIYEHWYLWVVVNTASVILFISRGLLPTVILYAVYLIMSFAGLKSWKTPE